MDKEEIDWEEKIRNIEVLRRVGKDWRIKDDKEAETKLDRTLSKEEFNSEGQHWGDWKRKKKIGKRRPQQIDIEANNKYQTIKTGLRMKLNKSLNEPAWFCIARSNWAWEAYSRLS